MFRFYNPYTYEHLYTTDVKEAADLRSRGWNAEGIGWYSPVKDTPGVVKIYRLYNPYGDDHLYTTEEKEKDDCIKRGWKLDTTFEAYGFISKQLGANAGISRLFNPYEKYHTHLFSANKKELEDNIKRGWRDEQVRWYVPGKPAEATPSATDTDVRVSTGSGSGSSHGDVVTPSTPTPKPKPVTPTPKEKEKPATPGLSDDQKTFLTEIQKPAKDLVEATRTNILKGESPEKAVKALQTKANEAKTKAKNLKKQAEAAGASDEVKKQAATAALVQKEAEFDAAYAGHVKDLNDKKAAYEKNTKDSAAKTAYDKALKAVEDDEKKAVPVTYTLHFINDWAGTTSDSRQLKDTQVTVYKCIATQKYSKNESDLGSKGIGARYTEAYAVADLVKAMHTVGQNDKFKVFRVRHNSKTNAYDVEYVNPTIKVPGAGEVKFQVSKVGEDKNCPADLPELNLSILGVDTSTYHAAKDDNIDTLTTESKKITAESLKTAGYLKLDSYRKTQIASEFVETEGLDGAAADAFQTQLKAFIKEADTPQNNPFIQKTIYELKIAEHNYQTAKDKKDPAAMLTARKAAIGCVASLVSPMKPYTGLEHVYIKSDQLLVRNELLTRLENMVLGDEAPKANASETDKDNYAKYVAAYVKWIDNPQDKDLTSALDTAYKAYNPKTKITWDINKLIG